MLRSTPPCDRVLAVEALQVGAKAQGARRRLEHVCIKRARLAALVQLLHHGGRRPWLPLIADQIVAKVDDRGAAAAAPRDSDRPPAPVCSLLGHAPVRAYPRRDALMPRGFHCFDRAQAYE